MSNTLESLRGQSTIVADTGDIASIARLRPVDATTNPSLVLKAVEAGGAQVEEWLAQARSSSPDVAEQRWWLGARFAAEIQHSVERWVSLEADATLSYDAVGTIACAERLLEHVTQCGGDPSRILIKVAATWEGVQAAQVLEARGIRCNLTLIFSLLQAQICAEGGITLISPFVGRITDWHKAHGATVTSAEDDPGVQSVRNIYAWMKNGGYQTLVMGASFRNTGQIKGLCGCDLLTIAPELMDELAAGSEQLKPAISRATLTAVELATSAPDASRFALGLAEDAMAGEKLLEGIRRFAADQRALEARLAQ